MEREERTSASLSTRKKRTTSPFSSIRRGQARKGEKGSSKRDTGRPPLSSGRKGGKKKRKKKRTWIDRTYLSQKKQKWTYQKKKAGGVARAGGGGKKGEVACRYEQKGRRNVRRRKRG